jgi:8-amino-7-oxononanoate synthase
LEDLEALLQQAKQKAYKRILIVTETVFSMDGDRTDIKGVAELANQYGALLFVDDAHAVGVWGEDGKGLGWQVPGVDLLLGTCGKALGSFGAYVACSREMKEYLVNFCPGFIYTTSPPPAVVGAIEASIDLLPGLNKLRKDYHEQISYLRSELGQLGFDTGTSTTQIIPIIVGDDSETLQLSQWLQQQGILATAIRPPTVAENSSRLRLTVTATHNGKEIDYLLEKLKEWKHG